MNNLNILCIALIIFIIGCSNSDLESQLLHKKNPSGSYGNPISSKEAYEVDELLSVAQSKLGQQVVLHGLIDEVCPMRGCWLKIIDKNGTSSIRVKVTDGEIVFPLSAKGKNVIAEGYLDKLEFTKQQAVNWKVHLAKEKGLDLDPDEVIITDADYYEYRINCTGAVIN
tara:strand:+ start:3154 stop:3660 length:507 start_codon:yes stop_codon:yes gene_type:complete